MKLNTWLYAFRDVKSGVLSNYFVSAEPFEKIKRDISITLLSLSNRDPNSPFVLFGDDYQLIRVSAVIEELDPSDLTDLEFVSCSELLTASRKAYENTHDQTSLSDDDVCIQPRS